MRVSIERDESEIETPELDNLDEEEDDKSYQATVAVQSVLRGRATQMLVRVATPETFLCIQTITLKTE